MAMANHDIALLDALYTLASGVPPDSEELARLQAWRAVHTGTTPPVCIANDGHSAMVLLHFQQRYGDDIDQAMMMLAALLPSCAEPERFTPLVSACAAHAPWSSSVRRLLVSAATAGAASLRVWALGLVHTHRADLSWSCGGAEVAEDGERVRDICARCILASGGADAALARVVALAARRAIPVSAAQAASVGTAERQRIWCAQLSVRIRGVAGAPAPRQLVSRCVALFAGATPDEDGVSTAALCASSFKTASELLAMRLRHHFSALDRRAARFRGPHLRDVAALLVARLVDTSPASQPRRAFETTSNALGGEVFGALIGLGGARPLSAVAPLAAAWSLLTLARAMLRAGDCRREGEVAPPAGWKSEEEDPLLRRVRPLWLDFVTQRLPLSSPRDAIAAHDAARCALLAWVALFCDDGAACVMARIVAWPFRADDDDADDAEGRRGVGAYTAGDAGSNQSAVALRTAAGAESDAAGAGGLTDLLELCARLACGDDGVVVASRSPPSNRDAQPRNRSALAAIVALGQRVEGTEVRCNKGAPAAAGAEGIVDEVDSLEEDSPDRETEGSFLTGEETSSASSDVREEEGDGMEDVVDALVPQGGRGEESEDGSEDGPPLPLRSDATGTTDAGMHVFFSSLFGGLVQLRFASN